MKILLIFPFAQAKFDRFIEVCKKNKWEIDILNVKDSSVKYDDYISEIIKVDSIDEEGELYKEWVAGKKYDAIVPFSEFSVILVEKISKFLKTPSNNIKNINAFRNKEKMRILLEDNNISQAKLIHVIDNEINDYDRNVILNLKFPVIVKPVDCAGSINVQLCNSADEVLKASTNVLNFKEMKGVGIKFKQKVLIEEYVDGPEYSIECLIQDKEIKYISNTKKILTAPPYFDEVGHIVNVLPDEVDSEIIKRLVNKIINAFDFSLGAMHVEYKVRDNRPYVIEIGFRIAGDYIPEMIEIIHNVNMEEELINIRAGNDIKINVENSINKFIGIKFLFSDDHNPIINESLNILECKMPFRRDLENLYSPSTHVFNRLGHIIFESDNKKDLLNIIEYKGKLV